LDDGFEGTTTAGTDPDGEATTIRRTARVRTPEGRKGVLDDQDLMVAVARGDASAFSALYDRLAPTVLGICLRVLRDRAEAEEVLGDVFLDLWRRADRYDSSRGAVAAYLVTQARTRAIDRLRSKARRQAREAGPRPEIDPGGAGRGETQELGRIGDVPRPDQVQCST